VLERNVHAVRAQPVTPLDPYGAASPGGPVTAWLENADVPEERAARGMRGNVVACTCRQIGPVRLAFRRAEDVPGRHRLGVVGN